MKNSKRPAAPPPDKGSPMRTVAIVFAALLALPLVPQAAASHVTVERYSVAVDGETALGWLAYPSGAPTTLLVYGHGCCGKPNQSAFVRAYAEAYDVVAVAMDYRGPGGWDVMKGSRDLVAATVDLHARFPTVARTVIWGVSMGGETTGMAVAQRPDLYDYWVDTFGVTNLFEEFVALGHYPGVSLNPNDPSNPTSSAIVRETGGTPATAPQAYADRSPVLMADRMVGLRRAYVTHGVGDPIVPYSMSREMFENLRLAGVPATLWTTTTGGGGVQTPYGVPTLAPCILSPNPCLPPSPPVGPSAHDGRGAYPSNAIVDQLLRGLEPDAGTLHVEHVADLTAGRVVDVPR